MGDFQFLSAVLLDCPLKSWVSSNWEGSTLSWVVSTRLDLAQDKTAEFYFDRSIKSDLTCQNALQWLQFLLLAFATQSAFMINGCKRGAKNTPECFPCFVTLATEVRYLKTCQVGEKTGQPDELFSLFRAWQQKQTGFHRKGTSCQCSRSHKYCFCWTWNINLNPKMSGLKKTPWVAC